MKSFLCYIFVFSLQLVLGAHYDDGMRFLRRGDLSFFGGLASNVDKSPATGSIPSTTGCCQICPRVFLMQLQLLQLSSSVEEATYNSFRHWHAQHGHAREEGTHSGATAYNSATLLELQEAQPCCSICVNSFIPSGASFLIILF
jgi:hypothetical protein